MYVSSGEHAGRNGKPMRWTSEGIVCELVGGELITVSPSVAVLSAQEVCDFVASQDNPDVDSLWGEWELDAMLGTFRYRAHREGAASARIVLDPDVPEAADEVPESGDDEAKISYAELEKRFNILQRQMDDDYWRWSAVDSARRVTAVLLDYHADKAFRLLAMLTDASAVQWWQIMREALRAALDGEQNPAKLGVDLKDTSMILRLGAAISRRPGGLPR